MYYRDKFQITEPVLFSINWAGLRLARQALTPGTMNFSLKYGIDWLATGKQTQRYGNLVNECILCGGEETNIHLLLCPNRVDTMLAAIGQFHAYLIEIKTEPGLTATIITQLARHLVLPYKPPALTPPTDAIYRNAIAAQNKVSWYRFVRGYLVNDWATIQDTYLVKNNSSQLGDSWSAKVSLWWIKKSYEIWMSRNNCIHNQQPGLQNRMEEEILARVQQLYEQADQLPAADREMLDLPLADRLLQPIQTLKRWLDITGPTVNQCIRDFNTRL